MALYFFSSYLYLPYIYGDLRADVMMQLICFPEGTSRYHDFNTVVYIAYSLSLELINVYEVQLNFQFHLLVVSSRLKNSNAPVALIMYIGLVYAAGAPVYRIPSLERLSICNIMAAPCYYISSRHAVRTKNVDLHMKFTWNRKQQKRENGMDNGKRARLDY